MAVGYSPPINPPITSMPPSGAIEDPALGRSLPPESAPHHRPALTRDGRVKILVAEDERLSRELLMRKLLEWGYEPQVVADGAKALSTLFQSDAPRLAVLDWEMPGLSGIDVCRLLRGRPDMPYVYVLLCTGREGQRQLIDGLAAGADDYIKKPLDLQELEVRLRAGRRIVLLQDQLLHAQAELERRALHDSLTGVKNRGAILDVLNRELARNKRAKKPMSIVLGDVDYFKRVNDTYGHPAGDDVLREFVKRAQRAIRVHDDVGRYGGEEFLLVLPECPAHEAVRVAERLRAALERDPVKTHTATIQVTASFGVSGTDQGYAEAGGLIAAADAALYAAKAGGRNRIVKSELAEGMDPALTLRGS